MVNQSIL